MKRFLALALTVLILSGCTSKTEPAAPAGSTPQAQASKPLVIVQSQDVVTLDPHMTSTLVEANALTNLFDSLTAQNEKAEIVPKLASSYQLLDDKLTWEFKLRPDVKFHNGEVLDANAVKFTFDRAMDPATQAKGNTVYLLNNLNIDTVSVKDAQTVHIKTKAPNPVLPNFVTEFYIIPPKYYKETSQDETNRKPVGSGPYKFVSWTKDEKLVVEANQEYWGGAPKIQQVIFRPIPDAASQIAEFVTGGADIVTRVPVSQVEKVKSAGKLEVIQGGVRIFTGISSYGHPALQDKRVRQALNYGVDVDKILATVLSGYGKRTGSTVNPPWQNPDVKPYPYDPEKAKALLKEAGYEKLDLTLTTPSDYRKDLSLAMAADLAKIGVNVDVQSMEFSTYVGLLNSRNLTDLWFLGSGSGFEGQGDISDLQKDSASNYGSWNLPKLEESWAQLKGEADQAKRKGLLDQMQTVVHDEAPYVFWYFAQDIYAVANRVQWKPIPNGRIHLNAITVNG